MGIKQLRVEGYKSYSPAHPFDMALGRITVLLGANGAGKSNLLSLFRSLRNVGDSSCPFGALSFYGSIARTKKFSVTFTADDGRVSDWVVRWNDGSTSDEWRGDVPRARVYQFNNTSPTAGIKQVVSVYDCAQLQEDGSNLAAVLRRLRDEFPAYYKRIVVQMRRVMPQFGDFELDDPQDAGSAILCWTDQGFPGVKFNPNQLSDGSLRFLALLTLLLSPPSMLPETIVLDEPEIGLHPKALLLLHGMIEVASENCQVILSTQSSVFVNLFAAEEIVVVEHDAVEACSVAKRLDVAGLQSWLEEFSLAEAWEKNLFGGNP